jgi:hypothetical protein
MSSRAKSRDPTNAVDVTQVGEVGAPPGRDPGRDDIAKKVFRDFGHSRVAISPICSSIVH